MTEWLVTLDGQSFDLERLSEIFSSPELNVTFEKEKDRYCLRFAEFDSLKIPDNIYADMEVDLRNEYVVAVKARATELLAWMNGIARIYTDRFKPVSLLDVVRVSEGGFWLTFK